MNEESYAKAIEALAEALDWFEDAGATKEDVEAEVRILLAGRSF